ncbi:alanine racemase [Acidovorax sp.]|uniref:alanine racemase n=1 Tax=Acidovorax sp. TaxID=1872122 RepID=UPI0025C4F208|nr:alanine racemase [Acidovorax sp.]MCI5069731.1 alanine racemase [Acidovorax sp.]
MKQRQGLNRRRVVAAGAFAASGAALLAARPADQGAPHAGEFAAIARALKAAGLAAQPTLVVDRARLRANAAKVQAHAQDHRLALRLVNKSLPSLRLLDEVGAAAPGARQMVFSLPYLSLVARERPQTDVLLGKPLPAAAAAAFLAAPPASGFDPTRQLQWLVDSPHRLAQYRDLARGRGQPLRINIEIDVGLHRGGVADEETLRSMLQMVREEPLLRFAGFMGYDAHTQKIPDIAGARERAHREALATYQRLVDVLRGSPLMPQAGPLTFNTAGSPTFRLHDGSGAANEVAVGSAMVLPSDFDTPLLADLEPATWIATPVLKVSDFAAPEGVGALGRLARAWDINHRTAHFIHGGHWLADPVSPPGLSTSVLMGLSSNQQLLIGSGTQALRPDDMVFFRPRQSEAVLQQFGDIAVYERGRIVDQWPVFPARG